MSIIKERRKEMDLSRRQLAKKLGCTMKLIERLEGGQVPTILQASIIYKEMGITYKQLVNNYKEEGK